MKTNSSASATAVYDRRICRRNLPGPLQALRLQILCLCVGLIGFAASSQVQPAWVARYNNGILTGTNQAVKMALDAAGNIYVTGFSQNTNGNLGYATIKYGPNGRQLWVARYDSTNVYSATPCGVAVDNSNNVIVSGNAVTIKYDTNGNQLWTAPYSATAFAVDAGGNVYVTGFGTNFNTEKLSATGSNVWSTTYVDIGPTLSSIVLVDSESNIYVGGRDTDGYVLEGGVIVESEVRFALVKYNANGNQLWMGEQFLAGDVPVVAAAALGSGNSVYVVLNWYRNPFQTTMFSNNGVVGWVANNPTGNDSSLANGLALDYSDNAFVTGQNHWSTPNNSYATYKINITGAYSWSNNFPEPPFGSSSASAIDVDLGNNIYVTGYAPGTNSGNDIVTVKYASNGNQIWVQRYNGPGNGNDQANAIAVDALGNVYVTGFDTTAAGGTEMVTIKYAPSLAGSIQSNGGFLVQTQGEPGEPFDVQATTNFNTWLDLGTINADTNGNLQFLDTNAVLYNQRFYITKPQ
jgi:hypothetical protein